MVWNFILHMYDNWKVEKEKRKEKQMDSLDKKKRKKKKKNKQTVSKLMTSKLNK